MTVLAHRLDGDGEPVLLLNGGLMTIIGWDPVVTRLTSSHRVVRCDFRGQLMSLPLGPPPPTVAGHAADLAALLDHLHIPRAHVVGTSFGALVGLELAAHHPDRVQSLVTISATDAIRPEDHMNTAALRRAIATGAAGGDGRPVLEIMAPYTFSPGWLDTNRSLFELRRAQFSLLPAAWYTGLEALLASLEHLDLRPSLPGIAAPTLVLAAEHDRLFPVERSRALADGIPGATLQIVPCAPHGWVAEDPAGVVDHVQPFLCQHSLRGHV